MTKTQAAIFVIVFGILALFFHLIGIDDGAVFIFAILVVGFLVSLFNKFEDKIKKYSGAYATKGGSINQIHRTAALVYDDDELNFTDEQLDSILTKHFPYYNQLYIGDKTKFLKRLKKFITQKIFYIHDESGFVEMPVLISAAAIQLTFGLDKYLLPNFHCIHIYPEEFIGIHPTLRILEGNVSGHSVNLSWKHFLKGFQFPDDGQNTGLHEFAHAYYYQYFEAGESVDKEFVSYYPQFTNHCDEALLKEQQPGNDLYTDYGLKNTQEFWAESVELFFEKPGRLKECHPHLYNAVMLLLNQDPVNKRVNLI